MSEYFEAPHDPYKILFDEKTEISAERMETVKQIAVHDCENHMKDIFVAGGKITPGQTVDAYGFAIRAINRKKITSEEMTAYCETFRDRYAMGYPTEVN